MHQCTSRSEKPAADPASVGDVLATQRPTPFGMSGRIGSCSGSAESSIYSPRAMVDIIMVCQRLPKSAAKRERPQGDDLRKKLLNMKGCENIERGPGSGPRVEPRRDGMKWRRCIPEDLRNRFVPEQLLEIWWHVTPYLKLNDIGRVSWCARGAPDVNPWREDYRTPPISHPSTPSSGLTWPPPNWR